MTHAAWGAQVVEWTPQNDLLGDSRVRAFVTHGGLNSIYEVGAACALVAMPFGLSTAFMHHVP